MTSAKLKLGRGLSLPVSAVTRTVAVVGQKGTGKTSTAVVIAEEAASVGARLAVMDPTGAWYGLRSSADGEGPGLDCVVMGGFSGDVPLDPYAGEVVARLVVEEGYSVVCDLERMPWTEKVRFVGDFSGAAFELCRSAVTIIYDEAHRFIGQTTGTAGMEKEERDAASRCRTRISDVVLLGRRKGLGSVLITQRPAKLHKDALEQADVLMAHRLMGNNDRAAIAGWLDEYGQEGKDWLAQLPRVKAQHALVIAPEYDVGGVFPIRSKATFDSSATPEVGAVLLDAPKGRSEIDLGDLEAKMGHALEQAQENDPDTLRRRIKRLEAQLAEGGDDVATMEELSAEYEKGWKAGEADAEARLGRELDELRAQPPEQVPVPFVPPTVREALEQATEGVARALVAVEQVEGEQDPDLATRTPEAAAPRRREASGAGRGGGAQPTSKVTTAAAASRNGDLGPAAKKILAAIAERYPLRFTRPQVARLADYAVKGGAFVGGFGELKRTGLIEEHAGEVAITPQGMSRAGVTAPAPPRTREEALELWRSVLDPSEVKIFDTVARLGKVTRTRLAGATGYTATGGRFVGIVGVLVRNGLLVRKGEYIEISDRATAVAS
jgi:hypothetical protein